MWLPIERELNLLIVKIVITHLRITHQLSVYVNIECSWFKCDFVFGSPFVFQSVDSSFCVINFLLNASIIRRIEVNNPCTSKSWIIAIAGPNFYFRLWSPTWEIIRWVRLYIYVPDTLFLSNTSILFESSINNHVCWSLTYLDVVAKDTT